MNQACILKFSTFTMVTTRMKGYEVGPDDHGPACRHKRSKVATKKKNVKLERERVRLGGAATRSTSRHRLDACEDVSNEDDSMVVEEVPTPPRPGLAILTRSSSETPTCLHYGVNRHSLYPNAFLCQHCNELEAAQSSGTAGRMKADSKRFRCQAKHTDWTFPDDTRTFITLPMFSRARDGEDRDGGVDSSKDVVIDNVVDDELEEVIVDLETRFERYDTQGSQECIESEPASNEAIAIDDIVGNELEEVVIVDPETRFEGDDAQGSQECIESELASNEAITKLKRRVQELENKLQSYERKETRRKSYSKKVATKKDIAFTKLKRRVQELEKVGTIKDLVSEFCTRLTERCTNARGTKKAINTVVEAVFLPDFLDGAMNDALMLKAKNRTQTKVGCKPLPRIQARMAHHCHIVLCCVL
jgi:hypothetical protein